MQYDPTQPPSVSGENPKNVAGATVAELEDRGVLTQDGSIDVDKMTVAELREFARVNDIPLKGARTRQAILDQIASVVVYDAQPEVAQEPEAPVATDEAPVEVAEETTTEEVESEPVEPVQTDTQDEQEQ